jgi:hypothetical protein
MFGYDKLGMIGSGKWLFCEMYNGSTHEHRNYCQMFDFDKNRPMKYIAGTIFVVRAKIFKEFFSKHNPIKFADELEFGDVQEPSKTHAWERMFATIVEESGFGIVGI